MVRCVTPLAFNTISFDLFSQGYTRWATLFHASGVRKDTAEGTRNVIADRKIRAADSSQQRLGMTGAGFIARCGRACGLSRWATLFPRLRRLILRNEIVDGVAWMDGVD